MLAVRWPDGKITCPTCGTEKVKYLANARVYKCYSKHPRPKFSLKVGTIFEDSPIALEKWLPAVWLLTNCKNGISSYEIARDLGVTQKSAWFMMHRIRLALHSGSLTTKIGGGGKEVEIDETFIGGKARNMHKHVKERRGIKGGNHTETKVIVMGVLERKGHVRTQVIPDRVKETVQPIIRKHVAAETALFTDEMGGYRGMPEYTHEIIDHAVEYVRGKVHTNGMENFWSLLKRGLHGTYVSVEPFHLFRYLDEQSFRYNYRATEENPMTDADRFKLAMSQIVGKRLTYSELTGKTQELAF